MDDRHTRRYRGFVLGRLILTTTAQAAGAPMFDPSSIQADDVSDQSAGGYCIVAPWHLRRTKWGLRTGREHRGLCIGVFGWLPPRTLRERWRVWRRRNQPSPQPSVNDGYAAINADEDVV